MAFAVIQLRRKDMRAAAADRVAEIQGELTDAIAQDATPALISFFRSALDAALAAQKDIG